jgi:DNA recombination protein RmuC
MGAGLIILAVIAGIVTGAAVLWYVQRGRGMTEIALLREERVRREAELAEQRAAVVRLTGELSASEQVNAGLEEKLADQKRDLEELNKRMSEQFTLVADRLLGEKSEQLNRQQQERLDLLLKPLSERLADFKNKVEETYEREGRERHALKAEVMRLVEQNQRLSRDADNLTRALRGDAQAQGAWGEMILEKLLEGSGLVKGSEYVMQESTTLHDGSRLRPDAVVFLPEGKRIVIDSKVSLVAYDRYGATTDEAERAHHLRQHIESVRSHARGLGDKDYARLYGTGTVDFVLLFVPIEPAFLLALRERPEIFQEAYDRQVVMVSHTTLMATLRTIASIWKNERVGRHHLEIAERAGALYDKFVGFTDDLKKVGQQLNVAQSSYVEAMKKLSTGTGNLVRQTEMLKTLGAKTNKSIDPAFLNRAMEETTPGEP